MFICCSITSTLVMSIGYAALYKNQLKGEVDFAVFVLGACVASGANFMWNVAEDAKQERLSLNVFIYAICFCVFWAGADKPW